MGGYVSLAYAEMYPEDLQSITLFFSTYFPDTEEKKNTRRKSFRIIMEEYNKYVAAGVPNLFNPYEKNSFVIRLTMPNKLLWLHHAKVRLLR